ncbi:MAG: hypothetical protein KJZ84_24495 [Bryobacteraceae bacterium]|nr:hypothetical protein [Bryobacteraceae bacterium]
MPGSVQLGSVDAVLPYALAAAFTEVVTWPVVASERYRDGRMQVRSDAALPRRSWALTRLLPYADWLVQHDFWEDRRGAMLPFYFYPRRADHDPTGASPVGRYRVRFDGALSNEYRLGRWPVSFRLIEIS